MLAAAFTMAAGVGTLPDLVGLDRYSPFTQLVAFRPWALVGGSALLLLLLVVMIGMRRVWPFVAGLLAVLLVGAGLVLPRTIADPLPTGGKPITVLSFNAKFGTADPDAFGELIRAENPDIVAVLEAGDGFGENLEQEGYRLTSSAQSKRDSSRPVAVLVSEKLGDVAARVDEQTASYPFIEVTGGALGKLRFVAYHARSPRPGNVGSWRDDLAQLPRWCSGPTPAIVAGDFNATLDHSTLRNGMVGCADAADQRGEGLVPTWGPRDQRDFGPQIDHIIATTGITAESFGAHDIPGSDHRAVIARLRVPA